MLAEKLDRKRLALKPVACPNTLPLPFRTPATQAIKTTSAGLVQKKRARNVRNDRQGLLQR